MFDFVKREEEMMKNGSRVRVDAARHRAALIAFAQEALARRRDAGMAAIAAAAGLSRSTAYRHFPDRSALVAAALESAVRRAGRALDQDGWRSLAAIAAVSDRSDDAVDADERQRWRTRAEAPLRRMLAPEDPGAPTIDERETRWLVACVFAIARAGASVGEGGGPLVPASDMTATLRSILAAGPSESGGGTA